LRRFQRGHRPQFGHPPVQREVGGDGVVAASGEQGDGLGEIADMGVAVLDQPRRVAAGAHREFAQHRGPDGAL